VKNAIYDSRRTEARWDFVKPMLPKPSKRGRPPTARRGLLEAIGERTFGWLMRHRRLVRDSEKTETSAAAWIFIAMIRSQFRRLA
jgi:transposase